MSSRTKNRRGFTITELLVVIGLIALLIGILLPALGAVISSGKMTKSMNNMRQVATWMTLYSGDNREFILPSQFDYSENSYSGKVRAIVDPDGAQIEPQQGARLTGTWSDILWTINNVATYPDAVGAMEDLNLEPPPAHNYRYDSPDLSLYMAVGNDLANPFRSAAQNTLDYSPPAGGSGIGGQNQGIPKPFGQGAKEAGRPGFFAANNFFNSTGDDGKWFTTAQIRAPESSMYLVDSFAGEVIDAAWEPYDRNPGTNTIEVDFRYTGNTCLMLFLDSHVGPQGKWKNIDELQGDPNVDGDNGRGIRIQNLTSN